MAGRPPKPAFLKALNGSSRVRRARETYPVSEPLKVEDKPVSALQLSRGAKRIWKQLLEVLPEGLILKSDSLEFGRYCQLLEDRAELREIIAERGRTVLLRDENNVVRSEKPRPELAALHKTESELRLLGSLLGLTPSARQRVSVVSGEKGDALEQKLFG